ncbi:MAG: two-component regulator propeller domain-containing protein [Bacteroidota bacterium]
MNRAFYVRLLIVCTCLTSLTAQPQNPLFQNVGKDEIWGSYGFNDIIQDKKGFIWLATWAGLIKSDGINSITYGPNPSISNSLKGNKITSLLLDSQDRLWIGTRYAGLFRYDYGKDHFIQFLYNPSETAKTSKHDNILDIVEGVDGALYVGTETGLNRFIPEEGSFHHVWNPSDSVSGLLNPFIFTLETDKAGTIWAGTEFGLGRIIWDESSQSAQIHTFRINEGTSSELLRRSLVESICITADQENILWIGTRVGLKKFICNPRDLAASSFENIVSKDLQELGELYIPDIYEAEDRKLWIASFKGLHLFDPSTKNLRSYYSLSQDPNSLSSSVIQSLYQDKFNNLWVGADKGINRLDLDGAPFSKISLYNDSEGQNRVTGVIQSVINPQICWVTTKGGGLYQLDLKTNSSKPISLTLDKANNFTNFMSGVAYDDQQNLWLSTQGAGVIRIRERDLLGRSSQPIPYDQYLIDSGLDHNHVMSIHVAGDGQVWFGYWNRGMGKINPKTKRVTNYTTVSGSNLNLADFPVVNIAGGHDPQTLLVGTRGNGLLQLNYSSEKDELILGNHFLNKENDTTSLSNNYINSARTRKDGGIWVATENGLNLIQSQKVRYISIQQKAIGESICSLVEDQEGNLWVPSKGKIFKVSLTDSGAVIRKFEDKNFISKHFQSNAAVKLPSGVFLFGAAEEFTMVDPSRIKPDPYPPLVNLIKLKIANKEISIGDQDERGRTILENPLSETSSLDLTYKQNYLSFEFIGIHTGEANKINYAYQLEGLDNEWVDTDSRDRVAHYTNLPYKKFTFKVKATNSSGMWSEIKQLPIYIQPPWWLSDTAYLVYSILLLSGLGWIWWAGKRQSDLKHRLQLEKLEKDKIREVSQVKQEFYTHISHELKTPLTLIITPLEKLLRGSQEDVGLTHQYKLMYNNSSRLLKMINQLLDIQKKDAGVSKLKVVQGNVNAFLYEIYVSFIPLAEDRGITYTFEVKGNETELWFDRLEMEKVAINLLSNAFKFTPDKGEIKVVLGKEEQEGNWYFSIKDSGAGIASKSLPYIFDRFYQAKGNGQIHSDGGSGIGLFLSKQIVEAHKGMIMAESILGEGATFYVSLPMGNSHFQAEELAEEDTLLANEIRQTILPIHESLEVDKGKKEPSEKATLLVVDDNDDIRSYLKYQLSEAFSIEEARNGEEAWELAKNIVPDLILADISMPKMTGIELCQLVKTNVITSHIPVVLLTARSSIAYQVDGFQEGADAYITKPFNIGLLEVRIRNLILSRKRLQEKFAQGINFNPDETRVLSLDEEFLFRVREIINKYFESPAFSVDQLAGEVNMSRTQLYRKLKMLTGKSAKKLITDYRLRKARDLLTAQRYTVSEVSFMVGYNDVKSFREQFKKTFNKNPSDFVTLGSHPTS